MKYIEAAKFGGPEVLEVVEKETPRPGEGMLLVEVKDAGVNYGDVMARSGHYPTITKAPFVLGFEIAGVVREVGKGVNGFKPGDSIAAFTPAGGGYASHVVIPAATTIPREKRLRSNVNGNAARVHGKLLRCANSTGQQNRKGQRRRTTAHPSPYSVLCRWGSESCGCAGATADGESGGIRILKTASGHRAGSWKRVRVVTLRVRRRNPPVQEISKRISSKANPNSY